MWKWLLRLVILTSVILVSCTRPAGQTDGQVTPDEDLIGPDEKNADPLLASLALFKKVTAQMPLLRDKKTAPKALQNLAVLEKELLRLGPAIGKGIADAEANPARKNVLDSWNKAERDLEALVQAVDTDPATAKEALELEVFKRHRAQLKKMAAVGASRVNGFLDVYLITNGAPPATLQILAEEKIARPDELRDPWGQLYQFKVVEREVEVWSKGHPLEGEVIAAPKRFKVPPTFKKENK